jgi:hypothetical protein
MRVEAGEVAAGACHDPPAQGRVLKALWKVAQGEAVRLELGLQRGTEDAALDARGTRRAVHLQHLVHRAQVERDEGPFARAPGRDAAHHRTAAPERNQHGPRARGPVHQVGDVLLVPGIGDHIGRAGVVVEQAENGVLIGLSKGVGGAVVALGRADAGQRRQWREARRAQRHGVEVRHRDGGELLDTE